MAKRRKRRRLIAPRDYDDPRELCCPNCGSTVVLHEVRKVEGVRKWFNRCGDCRSCREYIPTMAELRLKRRTIRRRRIRFGRDSHE